MKLVIVIGVALLACVAVHAQQQQPPQAGSPIVVRPEELEGLGVTDLGQDQRTPTTRVIGGRRFAVVPVTSQAARRRQTTTTTTSTASQASARRGNIPAAPARITESDEELGPPIPYAFNFAAQGDDGGSHSREESRDASGTVTGSYTITDPDGRTRTVRYVADENGFRAEVETNEIGTETHTPAQVNFNSRAPSVASLVAEFEAERLRSEPGARRTQTTTTTTRSRTAARSSGGGERVIVLNPDQLQGAAAENIVQLLRSGRARLVSRQPIN